MKKHLLILFSLLISSVALIAQGADNASDVAYNGGWNNGTNGGSGFGAWTLSPNPNNGNAGFFIASSDINVAGESWGMYANSGNTASAVRTFMTAPDAADIISVNMDNGNINNGAVVGMGIQNASGENLLEVYFRGGSANYIVNNGSETDSGLGYSNQGISIEIELVTNTTYSVVLTNLSTSSSVTLMGSLANPAGGQAVAQVRLFNFNAGSGGANDQFFNELEHQTNVPLPVELISFEGTQVGNQIQLDWATASERDNDFFRIETSADGVNFEEVTIIDGEGNIDSRTDYQFMIENPKEGINYFRLQQVDLDGKNEFSQTISVNFNGLEDLSVFPNPAKEQITVAGNFQEGTTQVDIFNLNGQLVQSVRSEVNGQLDIDIADLDAGFYFIQVQDRLGNITLNQRFVKN